MTREEIETERARFEALATDAVLAVLLDQGDQLAALVEAEDFPLSVFFEDDALGDVLERVWEDAIVHFAAATYAELDEEEEPAETKAAPPPAQWRSLARAFAARWRLETLRLIRKTTISVVRTVVEEGVRRGWSPGRMADVLRENWPQIAKTRAARIAATEVIRAANYAAAEAAKAAASTNAVQMEKTWRSVLDGNERETHRAADGQTVALDATFTVGGYAADYPGDADLPTEEKMGCRCWVSYSKVQPAPKSWRDKRDERIRADYPVLKAEMGGTEAIDFLHDRETISKRQVRRILYEGSRT